MRTLRIGIIVGILAFLASSNNLKGQVTGINYILKYDTITCLYNCCIVIDGGMSNTPQQRAQFNAQYTIVVPTGVNISIDTLYMPLENNFSYTGTVPTTWQISNSEYSPPVQSQNDFHAIIPSLAPTSFYNDLAAGDTICLFGISVDVDNDCGESIRPFINGPGTFAGSDPNSGEMPSGGDFSNGFTIGSPAQLYIDNLDDVEPPAPELTFESLCLEGSLEIDLDAYTSDCQGPLTYNWSGPGYSSTLEDVSITPASAANAGFYEVIVTDALGCADTLGITAEPKPNAGMNQSLCGAGTTSITGSDPSSGTWSADIFNPGGASLGSTFGGTASVTFGPAASGDYYFIYSTSVCSDTMMISVGMVDAGMDQSLNCITLPGGSVTMATSGTGNWTGSGPGSYSISSPTNPTTTITGFTLPGVYTFTWTNGACSDDVLITVTEEMNAGPDQNLNCVTLPGGSVTMAATGSGSWTAPFSNPGSATILAPNSGNTIIQDFTNPGTYTFTWSNGSCSDDVQIVVTDQVYAGSDQSLNCITLPGGSVTMGATATASGTWTASGSNPGLVNIANSSNPTTTISNFPVSGTYIFTWSNGTCSDDVEITIAEQMNAGTDQNLDCIMLPGGSVTMGATGIGTWTASGSNPGIVNISNASSPTTTITNFPAIGTYIFTWSNGGCNDDVQIIVTEQINAGPDQNLNCITLPGGSATMAATGSGMWTANGGNPGSVTILMPSDPNTIITNFSSAGTYTFTWNNGTCSDDVQIIVTEQINAGPDQNLNCVTLPGGSATMAATGTGMWTESGTNPGPVNISVSINPTTTITNFPLPGTYTFTWSNGSCNDDVQIIVTEQISAGLDQNLDCVIFPGGSVTMAATGTGMWTAAGGNPSSVTIADNTDPSTTITNFNTVGTYTFTWSDGSCTDDVQIFVTEQIGGGSDQNLNCITLPGGSAMMSGSGTGTWTADGGNPGVATITNTSNPTTTITDFPLPGMYTFTWGDGTCSAMATVTVTAQPDAGADQTVDCAVLTGGSATMAATGTGIWTANAGNPGVVTISDDTNPTTTIIDFPLPGVYTFTWTDGSCSDEATVTVTAQPDAGADQTVDCVVLTGGSATMAATGTGIWTANAGNPGVVTISDDTNPTTTIIDFPLPGVYTFTWTDGSCSDEATVTVTAQPDAGTDQTVDCAVLTGGSATMAATGTGIWTANAGNPGVVTISDDTNPTTTIIDFPLPGVYTFTWTDGSCSDEATVTVTAQPDAGADQTVDCAVLTGGSATMAATGTGIWTANAGNPGVVTISDDTNPTTTIIDFPLPGVYTFTWTDGSCSDEATVTVTAQPDAGADQTVDCAVLTGGSATMAATGTGIWTANAGNPGVVTISDDTNPTTTIIDFPLPGVYTFTWTDGSCSDDVTVTVTQQPDAGADQTVDCAVLTGGSATMAATGTGIWTANAGNPGVVTISDDTNPTTTIIDFPLPGVYTFTWTDGACSDEATVTVTAQPDAGTDQTVDCAVLTGGSATMAATGTGIWTANAGNPGVVTISDDTNPTTTIIDFPLPGVYTFTWTDGSCSDEATVTVTAQPDAGADQTVDCAVLTGGSATMAATGTGIWTANAGNPGVVTISDDTNPTTTIIDFPLPGVYTFTWTDGACSDEATVTVTAQPDAGADQTVDCAVLTGGSATMAATGTGIWTANAGNPGVVTISDDTNPTTTIIDFPLPGVYTFTWTDGSCSDEATVTVTAQPDAGADQTVDCAVLTGGSATMAATGTGIWTANAGNPGVVTISDDTNPTTTIIDFPLPGVYTFTWTDGSCSDEATVTVTAQPDAGVDQTVDCAVLTGGSATMAATGTGIWTANTGNPGVVTISDDTNPTTTIIDFPLPGVYTFTWTDGACSDEATVTVTAQPDAGTDQTVDCAVLTGGSATMAATGTGIWTANAGNPGVVTISDDTNPTTTIIDFPLPGVYTFTWTDGSCSDEATVTVTAQPDAGADQTVDCAVLTGGSATMAATGTGIWTANAGNPGVVTISVDTNPTTTIIDFPLPGVYTFTWTDGACSDEATVTVTAQPDAGADQTVDCAVLTGGSATMAATGTGIWTANAGNPGVVTISDDTNPTTTIIDFPLPGVYTFTWTDGSCSDEATVTVTAQPDAGVDQTVDCAVLTGGSATMAATGTGIWTANVGNPGVVTISDDTNPTTTIIDFPLPGVYTFTWTDGACSDEARVVVTEQPDAGADQNVDCAVLPGGSATMAATATSAGVWTAGSGNPASVTITNLNNPNTTITGFPLPGIYTFTWTDGSCSDEATVTVTAQPDAGADQTVDCAVLPGGIANMAASGNGVWTAGSGNPGSVTITSSNNPNTTITGFPLPGIYTFTWTEGSCSDEATVTVTAQPDAGADQTVDCAVLPGGIANMAASGNGVWTAGSGNPGSVTITSSNNPNTTITGFPLSGIYTFIWTDGACSDEATVTVTAQPDAGADQTVDCAILPGGVANMAASGNGVWTAGSGNPGSVTITSSNNPNTTITGFPLPGIYTFIWTDGACSDEATVTVTAQPDAGADQTVDCAVLPGGIANMAASGNGVWTIGTNPGVSNISDPTNPNTAITNFSAPGIYTFIWTDGACSDEVAVIVTAQPNAGVDQTLDCVELPGGNATMSASGNGVWTEGANPSSVSISNANNPNTTISNFSAPGIYTFIWTDGSCSDEVTVTVTSQPDAGTDQTLDCVVLPGGSATMEATGNGVWTAGSNPSSVTISNANNPNTTISNFSAQGIYTFIWTDGACSDEMTVTVSAQPDAGADQSVDCAILPGGIANMAATGNGMWSNGTSPGSSIITDPSNPNTTITNFSAPGVYTFIWTDGACSDEVAVIVTAQPNAGVDQTLDCVVLPGGSATMAATGNGVWSEGSNPGSVLIASSNDANTTISNFSAPGVYTFIWTDGACSDEMTVTVTSQPNAGTDQSVDCAALPGGSATMAATGNGVWSEGSNPGSVSIASSNDANTTISNFSAPGVYTFIWTDGACSDEVTVTVTAQPEAGFDQSVDCAILPGGIANMAATGNGVWSADNSNPGSPLITNTTDPNTTITGFPSAGTYIFYWTDGTCQDFVSVFVTAQPDAGADQTVDCEVLTGGSATMAAIGIGIWTANGGNPGTVTISDDTNPTTTIINFPLPGIYTFTWTNGSCSDEATVAVTQQPDAGVDQTVDCAVLPGGSATMAATGTGIWTANGSNPGAVTISDNTNPTTTITGFPLPGVYTFTWTDGSCSDEVSIIVSAQPNAGADQTVDCAMLPGGSVTMGATGTGTWTEGTNPGPVNISNLNNPNTTISSFSLPGVYTFIWTDGACSDEVSVTVSAQPDAGPDQTLDCAVLPGGSTTLGAIGIGIWTANAGNPGAVTISDDTNPTTTIIDFPLPGVYTFIWTDGACSDEMTVTVTEQPDAGADINVDCVEIPGGSTTMGATGTGMWTASGMNLGSAIIANVNDPNTAINTFSRPGIYTFIWTNGACDDEVIITVTEQPDAGDNPATLQCFATGTATLSADVDNVGGMWSFGVTDGNAVITDSADPNTTVTNFSAAGTYELIWTMGACSESVIITVGDDCTCPISDNTIMQPTPNEYCGMSPAIIISGMAANPSDGTYQWEYSFNMSAYAPATGTSTNQNYTTVGLGVGTHQFRRIFTTTTPPICSDTSNVIIINVLEELNAGPDQDLLCVELPGGSVTMAATGMGGIWNADSNNPGTVVIVDNQSPTTVISDFGMEGTYKFMWENGPCSDTIVIMVTAQPDAGPDPSSVNCNITGTALLSAVTPSNGVGMWSVAPSSTGTAVIDSDISASTTVSDFSVAGTYELIWTVGNCSDSVFITVGDNCACPIADNVINPVSPDQYCDMSPDLTITGLDAQPANGVYQWQISTNSGSFADASGTSTNRDYNAGILNVGVYEFRRIFTTTTLPLCADTSNVITITVLEQPNAGADDEALCVILPGGSVTMTATGTGMWTAGANPGMADIADTSDGSTTISNFPMAGTYTFVWANGICTDEVQINVTEAADAGTTPPVIQCFATGIATLSAEGTGVWTFGTNLGTATITNPNDANTTVTGFTISGTYELIWTSNSCSDTVIITVGDDCTCPIGNNTLTPVNPDSYCGVSPDITITGSQATPAGGSYQWEYDLDATGFSIPSNLSTAKDYTTGFLGVGTHRFRRIYTTAIAPICSDTSNAIIIVVEEDQDAGSDILIECVDFSGGTTNMNATGTGTWTMSTGAGTATIVNPNDANSEINNFSAAGNYEFIWTEGDCQDEVTITVTGNADAGLNPPMVNCNITGTATISAVGTGMWSFGSTAGTATIDDAMQSFTTVSNFENPGTYQLIWTVGNCSDTIVITVGDECSCPIANNLISLPSATEYCEASPSLTILGEDAVPAGGTYLWEYSINSGSFNTAPGTSNGRDYTTSSLSIGFHEFRRIYTTTAPPICSDTSNIIGIQVNAQADAGPDQNLECITIPGGSVTMAGLNVDTWIASPTNPGTALITDAADLNTTITSFSNIGVYEFIATTTSGCNDTMSVTVSAASDAGVNPGNVNCFMTGAAVISAVDPSPETGEWSITASPGNASILDNSNPSTTVSGFEAPGTYELTWTVGNCTDIITIIVGDNCDCTISNNILDPVSPTDYCEMSPDILITGTDAQPAGGTYQWQYSQNMAAFTIPGGVTNGRDFSTGVLGVGMHEFIRIYTNTVAPICSDTSNIIVILVVDNASAGPDQNLDCISVPGGSTNMNATGSGTWTINSGNAGMATLLDVNDPTTEVSGFTAIGTYVFTWSDGTCTDEVEIEVTGNADAGSAPGAVDCFMTGSAVLNATGNGNWTFGSSNLGMATFGDPTQASTLVSGFNMAGSYDVIWTVGSCSDTLTIIVGDDCSCPIASNSITSPIPNIYCGESIDVTLIGLEAIPAGGTYQWEYSFNSGGFNTAPGSSTGRDFITGVLGVGVHEFRRIYTTTIDPICMDTSNVVMITVVEQPDAGTDKSIDCTMLPGGIVTMAGSPTGVWSADTNNPGTADITDENNPTTTIVNFSDPGIYNFIWTNQMCSDTMTVSVSQEANAGIDPPTVLCFEFGTASLSATGDGVWTINTMTTMGTAIIANPNLPQTTVSDFSEPGMYELIWTVDNCSDAVIIMVLNECDCQIANNTITPPTELTYCDMSPALNLVGQDATPAGGTYQWEYNFNNIGFNFALGTSTNRDYTTGSLPIGTHDFRRIYTTVTDPICMDTSNVITITVLDQPNAGIDQDISCIELPGGSVTMNATGTGNWSAGTNPGSANIATTNSATTTISGFTNPGLYTFIWDNGTCSDEMTVNVLEMPDAGLDPPTVGCFVDGTVTLAATGTGTWSLGIGSMGTVTFSDVNDPNATVFDFTTDGTYELIWTVGNCTDAVMVVVLDDCDCLIVNNDILDPSPNEFCESSPQINIIGEDASPSNGNYSWEYRFNNGTFNTATGINNNRDYTTDALSVGTHDFRRIYTTTSEPICMDTSNLVTITVIPSPDAGIDKEVSCITLPGGSVTMTATGTGQWMGDITNPIGSIITDINDPNTTIANFTEPGEYRFTWGIMDCEDEVVITVTEAIDAGPDPAMAECFMIDDVILNASGNGSWSIGANSSGSAVINDINDPNAILSGFTAAGVYELIWTIGTCTDIVEITVDDNCPCEISNNNITDPTDEVFCLHTGPITLTGTQAIPAGGSYLWEMSLDGSPFSPADGVNNQREFNSDGYGPGDYLFRRTYSIPGNQECVDTSNLIDFFVFSSKGTPGPISVEPQTACLGDSLLLTVKYHPEIQYNWQVSGGGRVLYQLDSMSMIMFESSGNVTVTVTQSLEGCDGNQETLASTIEIEVYPTPRVDLGRDSTFCELDDPFMIEAGDFESYEWHDGSMSDNYLVDEEGIYSVTVKDTLGCVGSDMIEIKSFCCEFAYPNIIKAMSGTENGEFSITDIYECAIESELLIFDRWGNLIYKGDNGLDPWNGTFKGQPVEQGVYVFMFSYNALDENNEEFDEVIAGDITVVR